MKKKIDTAIIGATYFGIGYATVHPGCLILESGQIAGSDFHRGVLAADISGIGAKEAECDLGKLMKEHCVWENDQFDILKAVPVFHKYLTTREDMKILLDAKVLSVIQKDGGYIVKYITNSGISEICCDQVLDTTARRDTFPEGAQCTGKALNLFTLCHESTFDDKLKAVCPDCIITNGKNPEEKIVAFPFDTGVTLLDAYKKVLALWKKAFPDSEEKILFIAQDFDCVCEPINEENAPCRWISVKFDNPLTAFVSGMKYQL